VIDGQAYVLKHLDLGRDWTMRASGCLRGAPLVLWERGILARLPGCLNQPIVAAAPERRGCALLMHDVGRWLVPATDAPIPLAQHTRFLRHMAVLHATFWACGDEFDVVPAMHRYLELSPWMAAAEAAAGSPHLVPRLVAKGWPLLAEVAPAAAAVVTPLARDPGPLVEALAATPRRSCIVTSTTWAPTTRAARCCSTGSSRARAPLSDLAWYLDQLPPPAPVQGASIAAYREELEGCGVDTGSWWERRWRCACSAPWSCSAGRGTRRHDEELAWWRPDPYGRRHY
jgi:hypothetical protein